MKYVLFHAEVAEDLREAKHWYDRRRKGLGSEFQTALEEILELVAAKPLRFAPVHGEVRCARLKRFPYGVFYRQVREDTLTVLAVMHQARDAERWKQRL